MPAIMDAIDKMTTAEKLDVMNYLWKAVAADGEMPIPVWRIADLNGKPGPAPKRVSQFGSLKDKITYMSPDFDEPLEDFAEYM